MLPSQPMKPSKEITIVGPFYKKKLGKIKPPTIFVDRGSKYKNKIPGICIGDGDSYRGKMDILLSQEKDYSDLAFVLQYIGKNARKIKLLGFLGGRKDHELMNFGEIYAYLERQKNKTEISLDQKILALSAGKWRIPVNGIFSVFSLSRARISIRGACKYKLLKPIWIAPLSSRGLSNRGYGFVEIQSSHAFFVYKLEKH